MHCIPTFFYINQIAALFRRRYNDIFFLCLDVLAAMAILFLCGSWRFNGIRELSTKGTCHLLLYIVSYIRNILPHPTHCQSPFLETNLQLQTRCNTCHNTSIWLCKICCKWINLCILATVCRNYKMLQQIIVLNLFLMIYLLHQRYQR